MDVNAIPGLISAVGALGLASMGVVEAFGKSLFVYDTHGARNRQTVFGLPYAGYGSVRRLVNRVAPALKVAYGDQYAAIILEQYRNGRGGGQAPDTIRQGVRLGLPYLSAHQAEEVISAVWGLKEPISKAFAQTLTAEKDPTTPPPAAGDAANAKALAARFATALDTSVGAAFSASEAIYQSWVRFWAGAAAVIMSVAYYASQPLPHPWPFYWFTPLIVGLVAVPLAPIAKDLSTGVSQALTALGQIRGKPSGS